MQINPVKETNPVSDICRQCQGWCCFRFIMKFYVRKNGEIDWGLESLEVWKNHLTDLRFVHDNFRKVYSRRIPWQEDDHSIRRNCVMTCKQYDPDTRLCKSYNKRPLLCRKYVCDTAYYLQEIPDRRSYPATAAAFRKAGIPLVCGDGRKSRGRIPWCDADVHRKLNSSCRCLCPVELEAEEAEEVLNDK